MLKIIKYAIGTICSAKKLANSLKTISSNAQVCKYLSTNRIYSSSAMGLLGLMFYDMAVDAKNSNERELVRKTASRIILLTDIVDDIIDKRSTNIEDKFAFLDEVKLNLFGYQTNHSNDVQEEACYVLARFIYDDFLIQDKEKKVENIFNKLIEVIKKQFTETNTNELLIIAKTIGACCADVAAVLTEIVTNKEYPHIRESARKIGEYCEFIDNWYELNEDIQEGVNTYPTIRIRQEKDNYKLRKKIKKTLLTLADESIKDGFKCLTNKQKSIYKIMKTMIDFKYKIIKNLF